MVDFQNSPMPTHYKLLLAGFLSMLMVAPVIAQGPGRGQGRGQGLGQGRGQGQGRGLGQGQGRGHDDRHAEDQEVFHFLLANHDKLTRHVTELPNGVETLTESNDPEIAGKLQEHVEWMKVRVDKTQPIRMRDPLFREIFKHTDKIKMEHEATENGVKVIETSDDPYVVSLIQAHAKVVSGFVEHGFAEAMKNHPVPGQAPAAIAAPHHPKIANHGSVVRLPDAAQQPREGTKLCVDLIAGGEPQKLNAAIEKVAKYVNIFAGAGKEPAAAEISIVLHGEATLAVLNDEAYAAKFKTIGNPNAALLRELHEQGVTIYVCGQSLLSKGGKPEETLVFVDVAVSALTAVVNQQMDGFSVVKL